MADSACGEGAITRSGLRALLPLLPGLGLYLLFGAFYLLLGALNEDEGWYLVAGQRVLQGYRPWLDFAFTQGPVMPWVHGPLQAWLGPGLLLGRCTSLLLGAAGLLLAGCAAGRLGGPRAAWFCALALGANPSLVYLLVLVKTYAPAVFFTSLALYWLADRRAGMVAVVLAGLALALAAGTRLSLLAALPVFWWLGFRRGRAWGLAGLAASGGLLLALYGPALWQDPGHTFWNLVGYHFAGYQAYGFWVGIWRKLHTLWVTGRVFLLLVCVAGWVAWRWRQGAWRLPAADPLRLALPAAGILVFLVHLVPSGAFEDYQVVTAPWWAVWAGWGLAGLVPDRAWSRARRVVVGLVFVNGLVGRGQAWIDLSGGRLPLVELVSVAEVLRENTPPHACVFTPHVIVAVEAGRCVPAGQEMGIFAYHPGLTSAEAWAAHVMDDAAILAAIVDEQTAAVVLTPSDFLFDGAHCPLEASRQARFKASVQQTVDGAFEMVFSQADWGQFQEPVQVYVRRVNPAHM